MKIIISTLIILTSLFSFAQNEVKKKEINFEVAGACDMCKSRIEESLDIKGIKFAEWDKESHNCKIIFDPRKISEDDIHSTIAEIGHDTDKVKTSDKKYNALHECCHYTRIGETTHSH